MINKKLQMIIVVCLCPIFAVCQNDFKNDSLWIEWKASFKKNYSLKKHTDSSFLVWYIGKPDGMIQGVYEHCRSTTEVNQIFYYFLNNKLRIIRVFIQYPQTRQDFRTHPIKSEAVVYVYPDGKPFHKYQSGTTQKDYTFLYNQGIQLMSVGLTELGKKRN